MATTKQTISDQIQELMRNEAIKNTLAEDGLRILLNKIKILESDNKALTQINDELNTNLNNGEAAYKSLVSDHEELKVIHMQLQEREQKMLDSERLGYRQELKIESLKEQVEFLKSQNEMILRNAEIKRTINSIVPIAVQGTPGLADNGCVLQYPVAGSVQSETSQSEIKESQS